MTYSTNPTMDPSLLQSSSTRHSINPSMAPSLFNPHSSHAETDLKIKSCTSLSAPSSRFENCNLKGKSVMQKKTFAEIKKN